MRKPIYILLLLLFPARPFAQTQPGSSIVLDAFKSLPKEFDGCEELCSYKDTPLKEKKYVWVTNMQGLGMIKVGGKVIRLNRTSEKVSGKTHREVYKGGGYTIVVTTKPIKENEAEESSYEAGSLEISYGSKTATFVIHGITGC